MNTMPTPFNSPPNKTPPSLDQSVPGLRSRSAFLTAFDDCAAAADPEDPLARWLDEFWPQVADSAQGSAMLAPHTAQWLQGLSHRFGLEVEVSQTRAVELAHLYDVCVLGLGPVIHKALRYPELDLRAFYDDWPELWVRYVQAVARGEQETALQLARQLEPLAADCVWPPGVFVLKKDSQGLPLPTHIPARLQTCLPS